MMSVFRYSIATSRSRCEMVISLLIPILFIVLMLKETGSLHNRHLNRCAINVSEWTTSALNIHFKYFHEATSNKFMQENNLLDSLAYSQWVTKQKPMVFIYIPLLCLGCHFVGKKEGTRRIKVPISLSGYRFMIYLTPPPHAFIPHLRCIESVVFCWSTGEISILTVKNNWTFSLSYLHFHFSIVFLRLKSKKNATLTLLTIRENPFIVN